MNAAEAVMQLARERSRALVEKDARALDRILAPEFIYTNASGQVLDKATYLARYVEPPEVQWLLQELDHVQVRVFGDAAVLTCRVHDVARFGEHRLDAHFQSTYLYVNTAAGWQCVAGQTGPAAES
jgi:hypothetical protein